MTIRCVPCPKCRRVPVTEEVEFGGFRTQCVTRGCKNHLVCVGKTEDQSRTCWNGCIDRGDY